MQRSRKVFNPYEMGMQVSRGMDTEVSEEAVVCGETDVFGGNVQGPRSAERVPSVVRVSFARSYPHADIDTTEVFGFSGCRLSER